jgi:hypothetical protein
MGNLRSTRPPRLPESPVRHAAQTASAKERLFCTKGHILKKISDLLTCILYVYELSSADSHMFPILKSPKMPLTHARYPV